MLRAAAFACNKVPASWGAFFGTFFFFSALFVPPKSSSHAPARAVVGSVGYPASSLSSQELVKN